MTESSTMDIKGRAKGTKALVVYYSRSETTHKVAMDIAREMGADVERITDGANRSGLVGYMRSGKEASQKLLVDIDAPNKDPADYDLVIVGTPVWAWTMCSPVRTYLTRYGPRIARAAFFCTADGREKLTIDDMANILGRPGLAGMVVYRRELKKGTSHSKVRNFVAELRQAQPDNGTAPMAPSPAGLGSMA